MWAFEKKPSPLRRQTTAPQQAQQAVPASAGNQAMLAMFGIQDQSGDTRFSEALRAKFAPKPMPQAERSQPMALSPEVLQKAEERYQTPLTGLKAYEDTGLLDSGYNGYAQGNEIHIDGSLAPAKREEVLMHEVGHVVQRGSGRAQGSGLLDNPALEQQADQGFAAPQSFAMPTSAAGPVMGDFDADRQGFRAWKAAIRANQQNQQNLPALPTLQQRWVFTGPNRVYESVENGQVGSIYYGEGNQNVNGQLGLRAAPMQRQRANGQLTPPNEEVVQPVNVNPAVGMPRIGTRLRLLHQHGPKVDTIRPVERFVVNGQARVPIDPRNPQNTAGLQMREWFYNPQNNNYVNRHPSRGSAQRDQAVDNLLRKDHEKLLRAVMFAQHLSATVPDNGNQFLYAYMKSHPRLADIPLNTQGFNREWQYRTPIGSWITRQWKRIRGK